MGKFGRIFSLVLGIHVALGASLLFQQGCKTAEPEAAETLSADSADDMRLGPTLDPAFNAGLEDEPYVRSEDARFFEPRRPRDGAGTEPFEPLEPLASEPLPAFDDDPFNAPGLGPLPQDIPSTDLHRVERGDTLWAISRAYGVTLADLLAANNLAPGAVIVPGQELVIPDGSGFSPPPAESLGTTSALGLPTLSPGGNYQVQRGDTLSGIAGRFGTTVRSIMEANNLTSDRIFAGQVLAIPEAPPEVRTQAAFPTVDPFAGRIHVVERGETPGQIARLYGLTAAELMQLNNITDPTKLRVGQILQVEPQGTAAPAGGRIEPRSTPEPIRPAPRRTTDSFDDGDVPLVPIEEVGGQRGG